MDNQIFNLVKNSYQNPDEREYYAKQLPAKNFSIFCLAKNLKKALKQIELLSEIDDKIWTNNVSPDADTTKDFITNGRFKRLIN